MPPRNFATDHLRPRRKRIAYKHSLSNTAARQARLKSGQTVIGGVSEAYLDGMVERLRGGYGVDCLFGPPQVSYRETIAGRIVADHSLERRTDAGVLSARVRIAFEPDEAIGPCRLVAGASDWTLAEDIVRAVETGIGSTTGILMGAPVVQIGATLIEAGSDGPGSPVTVFEAAARNALRGPCRGPGRSCSNR